MTDDVPTDDPTPGPPPSPETLAQIQGLLTRWWGHPVVQAVWYAALLLAVIELWDTPGPDFRYFGL